MEALLFFLFDKREGIGTFTIVAFVSYFALLHQGYDFHLKSLVFLHNSPGMKWCDLKIKTFAHNMNWCDKCLNF
jgi:hypothetical protein